MMTRMVLAGVFALSAAAGAQVSFQGYVDMTRIGKVGPLEGSFAQLCGVDRSAAKIVYGHSLDEAFTFSVIPTVGDASEAQIDNYGSAEVWYVDGKPRLANVWYAIMDTGNYADEQVCLSATGKVTARQTLNTNEPPGDDKDDWRHVELVTFAGDGKQKVVTNQFLDADGAPTKAPVPALDKDSMFMATTQTPIATLMKVIKALPLKAK